MPVITSHGPAPTPSTSSNQSTTGSNSTGSNATGSGGDPAPAPPGGTPTPPPPADTFESTSTLSQRKIAERALARAGHNPGAVDGKLTAKSRSSLKAFQKGLGLPPTGELDQKTFTKLKALSTKIKKGSKTLQPGMKSSKIKTAEQQLRRLGYDTGAVDGLFTQRTADAVKALRKDQKNLDGTTGNIGAHGLKVLDKEVKELFHAPYRSRVKNTAAHKAADKRATKAAKKKHNNGTEGMGVGSKGPSVAYVKQHLRAAGYDPQNTNQIFDERTEGMVKELQRKSKIPVTGRVDERTWGKLRKAKMEAKNSTSPSQRIGERSGAVKTTEKLLKKIGYSPGAVDGLYTKQTQRALDRFRKAFNVGGKGNGVGPSTLKKLKQIAKTPRVSANDLVRIMPGLSAARARKMVPHLHKAMTEFGINTPKRQAAFLAQVGHESVSLRYFEEIASGAAYEGRTDLGNVRPGDGVRYKGRGPIQLTGRSNYRRAGQALNLPLEAKPKMAARISVGFRTAGWFWKTHGLNELADQGAFDSISIRINGGTNGLQDRRDYHARARAVLMG